MDFDFKQHFNLVRSKLYIKMMKPYTQFSALGSISTEVCIYKASLLLGILEPYRHLQRMYNLSSLRIILMRPHSGSHLNKLKYYLPILAICTPVSEGN